jgi:hypothetical protein
MEIIKIERTTSWGKTMCEFEVVIFQIDNNGNDKNGNPAICTFCKKSMKANSVAYDWKGDGWVRGGYTFCAKSHLKNWLKINKST